MPITERNKNVSEADNKLVVFWIFFCEYFMFLRIISTFALAYEKLMIGVRLPHL